MGGVRAHVSPSLPATHALHCLRWRYLEGNTRWLCSMQWSMCCMDSALRQLVDLMNARIRGDHQEAQLLSQRIKSREITRLSVNIHNNIQRRANRTLTT